MRSYYLNNISIIFIKSLIRFGAQKVKSCLLIMLFKPKIVFFFEICRLEKHKLVPYNWGRL